MTISDVKVSHAQLSSPLPCLLLLPISAQVITVRGSKPENGWAWGKAVVMVAGVRQRLEDPFSLRAILSSNPAQTTQ